MKSSIDFRGKRYCSAVASLRNIACLISQKHVTIIRLDEVVEKRATTPTLVSVPVDAKGKKLASAAIYGEHLYVAETPATGGEVILDTTDFNDLLQLDSDDSPQWEKRLVGCHVDAKDASVSLFTTKLKNPSFVSK